MGAYNFRAQFAEDVESGRKTQTIRAERKDGRRPKVGDTLKLYTGMRTKACRLLAVGRCTAVVPITIEPPCIYVAGKAYGVHQRQIIEPGEGGRVRLGHGVRAVLREDPRPPLRGAADQVGDRAMSDGTKIQWTDATWSPVRGCAAVSAGCSNCYAQRTAHRFSGPGQPYEGLTRQTAGGPKWTGAVRLVREVLDQPLRWRKPRRVFVNSMSDLFHGDVPDDYIDRVWAVMAQCPNHTFQILTKRPERMRDYLSNPKQKHRVLDELTGRTVSHEVADGVRHARRVAAPWIHVRMGRGRSGNDIARWYLSWLGEAGALPNVWLGVSCEDQSAVDERIPLLLKTPAAVRFVSAEPLLGPLNFRSVPYKGDTNYFLDTLGGRYSTTRCGGGTPFTFGMAKLKALDWVIAGGESGPGARPCNVEWIRSIVNQCREAKVPVFVKQLGAAPRGDRGEGLPRLEPGFSALRSRKGDDMDEWPEDLRVREWPEVRA